MRSIHQLMPAVLAITLLGCSGKEELKIGVDSEFPPWCYVERTDSRYEGFDVELSAAVAEKLGMHPVYRSIVWAKKHEELASGRIDCVWCGFTTRGREDDYTMTEPYMDVSLVFLVRTDSGIRKFSDLNDRIIGCQTGSSGEAAFTENNQAAAVGIRPKTLVRSPYVEGIVKQLESGLIDAVVIDVDYAVAMASCSDGRLMVLEGPKFYPDKVAVAFRKGDTGLRDRISQAIGELEREGVVARLLERYFGGTDRWIWKGER